MIPMNTNVLKSTILLSANVRAESKSRIQIVKNEKVKAGKNNNDLLLGAETPVLCLMRIVEK